MLSGMNPSSFRLSRRAQSRLRRGRPHTLLLGLTLCAALLPGFVETAGAQEAAVADVRLVGQKIHHHPDDTLDLSVRVTNVSETPLSGLTLQAEVYPAVLSRTEFHDSFTGVETGALGVTAPLSVPGGDLGPGD